MHFEIPDFSTEESAQEANASKRNSLKNIKVDVNGIAGRLKSKFEPQVVERPKTRPTSVQPVSSIRKEMPTIGPNPRPISSVNWSQESRPDFTLTSSSSFAQQRPVDTHLIQSICYECENKVSIKDRQNVLNLVLHSSCFYCNLCRAKLDPSSYEHVYSFETHRCSSFSLFAFSLFFEI